MQNKSFINGLVITGFKLCTYKATFLNHKKNAHSYKLTASVITLKIILDWHTALAQNRLTYTMILYHWIPI